MVQASKINKKIAKKILSKNKINFESKIQKKKNSKKKRTKKKNVNPIINLKKTKKKINFTTDNLKGGKLIVGDHISRARSRISNFVSRKFQETKFPFRKVSEKLKYLFKILKNNRRLFKQGKKLFKIITKLSTEGKTGMKFFKKNSSLFDLRNFIQSYNDFVKNSNNLANLRYNKNIDFLQKCTAENFKIFKTKFKLTTKSLSKKDDFDFKNLIKYQKTRFTFFICRLFILRKNEIKFNIHLKNNIDNLKNLKKIKIKI